MVMKNATETTKILGNETKETTGTVIFSIFIVVPTWTHGHLDKLNVISQTDG